MEEPINYKIKAIQNIGKRVDLLAQHCKALDPDDDKAYFMYVYIYAQLRILFFIQEIILKYRHLELKFVIPVLKFVEKQSTSFITVFYFFCGFFYTYSVVSIIDYFGTLKMGVYIILFLVLDSFVDFFAEAERGETFVFVSFTILIFSLLSCYGEISNTNKVITVTV